MLFWLGALAMLAALAVDLVTAAIETRRQAI
jgi:hypothetical protein